MGNEMKGAMAFSSVKSKAGSLLNGLDSKPDKRKQVIENPETTREMNQRHKARDEEFRQRKLEREKKKASLKEKWSASQATK
mmetsp:Transcript_19152/g.28339  ORF Transcript_19152/g.28339 Transcript_19152/m.28339 type:complete len:82 (-) Transcript_19152:288-533(-)